MQVSANQIKRWGTHARRHKMTNAIWAFCMLRSPCDYCGAGQWELCRTSNGNVVPESVHKARRSSGFPVYTRFTEMLKVQQCSICKEKIDRCDIFHPCKKSNPNASLEPVFTAPPDPILPRVNVLSETFDSPEALREALYKLVEERE